MATAILALAGGHQAVFHRVSELQRGYAAVLKEVGKGTTVILQRSDEMVAVMLDPKTYNQLLRDASRTAELDREVELWKAKYDLAMAGGPTLAQVREEIKEGKVSSAAEARKRVLGVRAANGNSIHEVSRG